MTVEEMYRRHTELGRLNYKLQSDILRDLFGVTDLSLTFAEMGLDELDGVQYIMEIEKRLNISISDDVAEQMIKDSNRIFDFTTLDREDKLDKLGI
jgi:acyl carrier protein